LCRIFCTRSGKSCKTSFGFLIPTARKVSPLRQRMIDDITVRNFAPNTQESYLHQVSLFARYFDGHRSD
jgi:hypothetical protein